jgi:two-component system, NarL family, invasion response regulator UvrY
VSRVRLDVLLASEFPVVRAGLRALVAHVEDLAICGEASDGRAALAMVREREWGLVMLDLCMQGRSGLELIKLMKAERPRLPVLVYSAEREELYALRSIRAGAAGFLSLRADADTVVAAMRRAGSGRIFVSSEVTELLASHPGADGDTLPHDRLTDREYDIFSRIVHGDTLTHIAGELSLSIKTVSTHKSHILDKMTLGGQAELVRYAIEHRLLDTVRE